MNELKHLEEFQKILTNYQVSEECRQTLSATKLMLFTAPTSVGKNTIFRELLKTGHFHYIISDTTRKPRTNDGVLEHNGVEYWFKTEEQMLEKLKNGQMVEAAVIHQQQVSGVSIDEIQQAHDEGKVAMSDIDIVGTDSFVKLKPDTICFFIIPPTFEEWQKRLMHRGEISEVELRRRLESAALELEAATTKDYYQIIVNDNLEEVVGYIDRLARGATTTSPERLKRNRETLKTLLQETKEYLAKTN